MELTGADFDRIPRANLRVPVVHFAELWWETEKQAAAHPDDWYLDGVLTTCRWLACATSRDGADRADWYLTPSPVTNRWELAYEELIAEEAVKADALALQRPAPAAVALRPGWVDGVAATFAWAWRRRGLLPIAVPRLELVVPQPPNPHVYV